MLEHGLLESRLASDSSCAFTNYYQFFRESLFAIHKGGHFVLLHDARSPVFLRQGKNGAVTTGLWPLLLELSPAPMRSRLHPVTIQQVVAAIQASGRHQDWIAQFKKKYGIVFTDSEKD
jgi:POLQ-like helicase